MPRGDKRRKEKVDIAKKVADQLGIPWKKAYYSGGSTVTAIFIEDVLKYVSHRTTGLPPGFLDPREEEIWQLLHKSQEAAILAIELINRISVGYKIDSFAILLVNAWELLMKAKLLRDGKKSTYLPR